MKARIANQLRRIYAELVRRRARVRVVPATEAPLDSVPIFVIGIYRSGTTLLRLVLDSHSAIACPPESEFLTALGPLLRDDRALGGLQSLGFDDDHVRRRTRQFAAYFFENYARSQGKGRWADKSPRYVEDLDLLTLLFPEAQYVVIHRHPLDQIHSLAGDEFATPEPLAGQVSDDVDVRITAAQYWRDNTERILDFAAANGEQCVQIRYEDLCTEPERVMREVLDHLGEPWEPGVLEYYQFPHDAGYESGRAHGVRGFVLSQGHYRSWPPELVAKCLDIVKPTMRRLGYDADQGD